MALFTAVLISENFLPTIGGRAIITTLGFVEKLWMTASRSLLLIRFRSTAFDATDFGTTMKKPPDGFTEISFTAPNACALFPCGGQALYVHFSSACACEIHGFYSSFSSSDGTELFS